MRNKQTHLADVITLRQPVSELQADISWLVAHYGFGTVLTEVEMHHPSVKQEEPK